MATIYIGEKLDFLMKLTDTSNVTLARALNFESSHISRIRAGQRGLPKQRSFLEPASEFFARKIKEPFQIRGAEDVICPGRAWPKRPASQAALIARWLSSEDVERPFFSDAGEKKRSQSKQPEPVSSTGVFVHEGPKRSANVFYYGNEGRRQAVERFLEEISNAPEGQTMLLYSDESMDWLMEDPAFTRNWMQMMMQLLKNGTHIVMIHSISRSLGEMMDALKDWMPLYMAGDIEPWFCPKLRDEIFRQTRFVAPGIGAVVGSCLGNRPDHSSSIYVVDTDMVNNLEDEFRSFLEYCKPLMRIYRADNRDTLQEDLARFEAMKGDMTAFKDVQQGYIFLKSDACLIFSPPEANIVFAIKEPMLLSGISEMLSSYPKARGDLATNLLNICRKEFKID